MQITYKGEILADSESSMQMTLKLVTKLNKWTALGRRFFIKYVISLISMDT